MSVFAGDFLGFTLGNIHSSQLNITRVSSGDRYEDILLPTFKDTTMEVPGGDGTYYWNTSYTQKTFTLNFAYDDLRDEDLRKLRQVLSFKGVKELIFDEFPYKKYMVKCSAPPTFKYICFDYKEIRLYKGEGTVTFIAYYPYAQAVNSYKYEHGQSLSIINDGDLNAILKVKYPKTNDLKSLFIEISDKKRNSFGILKFNCLNISNIKDPFILFDFHTHLIEGLDSNQEKTGNLYNKFITSGDFFNVPPGNFIFSSTAQFSELECIPLYY